MIDVQKSASVEQGHDARINPTAANVKSLIERRKTKSEATRARTKKATTAERSPSSKSRPRKRTRAA
jgi:hypothetical protein